MKPTDDDLDLMAGVAANLGEQGFRLYDKVWHYPDGRVWKPCTDRNALDELWKAVREHGVDWNFGHFLCLQIWNPRTVLRSDTYSHDVLVDITAASSRVHVMAALHALGRWPKDWEGDALVNPLEEAMEAKLKPQACTAETPCCERRDEYNGFNTGPLLFTCPKHCPCHD